MAGPLLVLAVGGAAAPLDPLLVGRVAVARTSCIDGSGLQTPRIIDDHTLVYQRTNRRVWRNDLPERCRGLDPDDILVIESYGSPLCAGDTFRPLSRNSRILGPICRLGKFTTLDKPR